MIKVSLIVEPFSQFIDVFIGTDLNKTEVYINNNQEPESELVLDTSYINSTNGTFYVLNTKTGPYRFICLNEFSQKNIKDLQGFIHELYHAICDIIKQVGIKTKDPYDELTAYLLDCLLGKFLTKMKNKSYEIL